MGRNFSKRTFLGNIALVVFVAFLATLTFSIAPATATPYGVGIIKNDPAGEPTEVVVEPSTNPTVDPVEPAPVEPQALTEGTTVSVIDKDGQAQTEEATINSNADGTSAAISFVINPVTEEEFSNIWIEIKDSNGNTIQEKVYAGGTWQSYNSGTGQCVYNWVYSFNNLQDMGFQLVFYSGDQVLQTIALNVEVPPPEQPLFVVSTDPMTGAIGVPAGQTITVNFAGTGIKKGRGFTKMKLYADGDSVSSSVKLVGNQVTIDPRRDIPFDAECNLFIPANAITDAAKRSMAAEYNLTFTVEPHPHPGAPVVVGNPVISANPEPTEHPLRPVLTVTYDIDVAKVSASSTKILDVATGKKITVKAVVTGKTASFEAKKDLVPGQTYTLSVPNRAVRDVYKHYSLPYTFTFVYGD